MTTGEKIRYRRQQVGMTVRELAFRLGVSHGAVLKWEKNQTKGISDHHFAALAKALDCNILWLLDLDDAITLGPDNVAELVELPPVREVPIIGEIACGDPILAVENHDGAAGVPADSQADFALRCSGDSMINARIFPGDLVLIRQQSDVDSGEIAAVLLDGEATLKRVYKYDGRIELRPENPLYGVRSIEGQEKICRQYIDAHGYSFTGMYADRHISGRTDKRPEFQRMIDDGSSTIMGSSRTLAIYRGRAL